MASRTNEQFAAPSQGMPGMPAAPRTPSQPRERKPMLAALGVLLVLAGALAGSLLVLNSGNRISVVQVTQRIAAGQPIPSSAIREARVADDSSMGYLSWSQVKQMQQGHYRAYVDLVPGTLLMQRMLTQKGQNVSGKRVVGLSLKAGQFPSGLAAGMHVEVYNTDTANSGSTGTGTGKSGASDTPLTQDAVVYDQSGSAGGAEDPTANGTHSVSILVPQEEAGAIAKAASDNKVSLVLVPPGSGTGSGQ